jgi:hypothetical protein
MNDAKEGKSNVRWVVVVVLLMLGINGLLTRLLENIWVSLRDSGSPAYLPLEWWMAVPFTLFVFGVLSALLTSFSGGKNWLKTFCLLCGCKVVFTAVTAFFFSTQLYPDPVEAALQAGLLSLPSLLVHILLSGMLVLFLKEVFIGPIVREEPDYKFLPKGETGSVVSSRPAGTAEDEIEQRIPRPATVLLRETPAGLAPEPELPPKVRVPKETPAVSEPGQVLLPVAEILNSFAEKDLAMSPLEIERSTPVIPIPLEDIVPQLSEGRVQVEARAVLSAMPPDAFARPQEDVATAFPDGMMELPLRAVVSSLPSSVLELPEQETQPDVDAEFADFFHELEKPTATLAVKQFAPAVAARPAPPQTPKPAIPVAKAEPPAEKLVEEALVISDEERALLERSRDVITINTVPVFAQFPPGAVIREGLGEDEQAPDSLVVPLELIAPGLAAGEAKLHVKYIFPQVPRGCLAISELDIARSLQNGEVQLSLREVVPQLPSHFLAPPFEQRLQPELEEMPDPYPEEAPPVFEKPQPMQAAAARVASDLSDVSDLSEVSAVSAVSPAPTKTPAYAEMLREANPLELPIETVVRLLPEGAFRLSPALLKQHAGGETIRLPRSLVMRQLREGRVVVPVEILTAQFAPEHLAMSIEQVKARLAEGSVELPLREIVGQVLEEIAQPLERQQRQPECDEMPAPFEEPAATEVMAVARPMTTSLGDKGSEDRVVRQGAVTHDEVPHAETPRGKREEGTGVASDRVRNEEERKPVRPDESGDTGPAKGPEPHTTEDGRTILRTLLQKCKTLGISEHLTFSAGDSSAVVLAPSSFHREVMASGMVGIMEDMRRFCEEHRLGEPFKLLINSTEGVVAGAELVRGNPNRLIVLGSRNRGAGGTLSLLLDRFEPELRHVPFLMSEAHVLEQRATPVGWQATRAPLQEDGFPRDASEKVVAALKDVGIERSLSAKTATNDALVAVWGEGFDGEKLLTNGLFDVDLLLQYSASIGAGDFELALLVAQNAYATLTRLPLGENPENPQSAIQNPKSRTGARAVYSLCFFSPNLAEGLVRAKAARAAQSLLL